MVIENARRGEATFRLQFVYDCIYPSLRTPAYPGLHSQKPNHVHGS
jgi:hypothetical protein